MFEDGIVFNDHFGADRLVEAVHGDVSEMPLHRPAREVDARIAGTIPGANRHVVNRSGIGGEEAYPDRTGIARSGVNGDVPQDIAPLAAAVVAFPILGETKHLFFCAGSEAGRVVFEFDDGVVAVLADQAEEIESVGDRSGMNQAVRNQIGARGQINREFVIGFVGP